MSAIPYGPDRDEQWDRRARRRVRAAHSATPAVPQPSQRRAARPDHLRGRVLRRNPRREGTAVHFLQHHRRLHPARARGLQHALTHQLRADLAPARRAGSPAAPAGSRRRARRRERVDRNESRASTATRSTSPTPPATPSKSRCPRRPRSPRALASPSAPLHPGDSVVIRGLEEQERHALRYLDQRLRREQQQQRWRGQLHDRLQRRRWWHLGRQFPVRLRKRPLNPHPTRRENTVTPTHINARRALLALAALATSGLIAACGSSSSNSSSRQPPPPRAGLSGHGGSRHQPYRVDGVPAQTRRHAARRRGRTRWRRAAGAPAQPGQVAPAGGSPPSGGFPGGANGAKLQAAFKACGANFPARTTRRGIPRQTIQKYVTCVRQHGAYTQPATPTLLRKAAQCSPPTSAPTPSSKRPAAPARTCSPRPAGAAEGRAGNEAGEGVTAR